MAANGCDSLIHLTVLLNTSTKDDLGYEFQVYPNPASEFIEIVGSVGRDFKTSVWDITGKLVVQSENESVILLSGLRSGVYILVIEQEGARVLVDKLILQE